jgi:peptidoglycan/xylan/chitin deacetylase (PgdA/CDA1 family)
MIDPVSKSLFRDSGKHGPISLMYHSITKEKTYWPWAVSFDNFRRQLDLLDSAGWKTSTISDLVSPDFISDKPTVLITFDDGYLDNIDAVEELAKRKMNATLFVVSGYIGEVPGWSHDDRPKDRLLNASELKGMLSLGVEIGSHGRSHTRLTEMDDLILREEVHSSKAMIEQFIGKEISSFAYPHGAWNACCRQAVIQAGYKAACITGSGWALPDGDYFSLRRLTIYNTDNLSQFARKIALADNDVSWARIGSYYVNRVYQKYGSPKS